MSDNQFAGNGTTIGTAAELSGKVLTAFAQGDILDVTDLDPRHSSVTALYHPGDGSLAIRQDGVVKATLTLVAGLFGRFTVTTDRSIGANIQLTRATEGKDAQALDVPAAQALGLDGSGILVGVISGNFNSLGGMAQDILNGDLPADTSILSDTSGIGSDEGREMAQLIHKAAPGASIIFADDMDGYAGMARNIKLMVDKGARVIVDDVEFLDEPFWQPGDVLDQAIADATQKGVVFLTAAGNSGKAYYSHEFRLTTADLPGGIGTANAYDFSLGNGSRQYLQRIEVTGSGADTFALQWDEPVGKATYHLTLHLLRKETDGTYTEVGHSQQLTNGVAGQLTYFSGTGDFYIAITGDDPAAHGVLKYKINNNGKSVTIHDDNAAKGAGDISGHRLNPDEITVGEVGYQDTPAFGHTGALVNSPSSDLGPGQYLFNAAGDRLTDPPKLGKPDITGAVGSGTDVSGVLNGFSGTSAAAPNVAAVVAMMLQANSKLTTAEIKAALQQSALPMEGRAAGSGLVQAPGAVLLATVPSVTGITTANQLAVTNRVGDVVTLQLGTATPLTVTPAADGSLPTLALSDGGTATFDPAASGGTTLVFRSTVAAGQGSADLVVERLELNGATIRNPIGLPLAAASLAAVPGAFTGLVVDPSKLSAFAVAVSDLVNGPTGSTTYGYPEHVPTFLPVVDLSGAAPTIETDCSGWVHYALNTVAPLHDAVLQAQRSNPVFQGQAQPAGQSESITLDEANEPWTQADAAQYFYTGVTDGTAAGAVYGARGTNGFETVKDLRTVRSGDLLAYSTGIYTDPKNPDSASIPDLTKTKDTGHTLIITGPAVQVTDGIAGNGLKPGPYTVWAVPVVDSSNLLHFDDNRVTAASGATPGNHGTGTGSGEIWFVVDDQGAVQQFRFSGGTDVHYIPNDLGTNHAIKVGIARLTDSIDLGQVPLNEAGQFVVSTLASAQPVLGGVDYGTTETLTGQGAVLVKGSGTLRMAGHNTYVGPTELSGAGTTVLIDGADGLGADAGAVTLGDGTTLAFGTSLAFGHRLVLGGSTTLAAASGQSATVTGALSGDGLVVRGGITLSAVNSYTGGTTVSGGQLSLAVPGAAGSGPIRFAAGTASTLSFAAGAVPVAAVTGLDADDVLDFQGFDAATSTASYDGATLRVSDTAGHAGELSLAADPTSRFVHLARDAGGTGVAVSFDEAPCYCPGTLILTERGEVPVETLAIGDQLVTGDGTPEPIVWIGRRSYSGRFVSGRPSLLPVRICAGALGDGLPRRDLLVSPLHAMVLDGRLVPAGLLVNGRTIRRVEHVAQLDYVHLELPRHAVIWAEGAASESFLDDGSRGMFHNAAEHAALYPDAPPPGAYCLPRLEGGRQLVELRRRLAAPGTTVTRAA